MLSTIICPHMRKALSGTRSVAKTRQGEKVLDVIPSKGEKGICQLSLSRENLLSLHQLYGRGDRWQIAPEGGGGPGTMSLTWFPRGKSRWEYQAQRMAISTAVVWWVVRPASQRMLLTRNKWPWIPSKQLERVLHFYPLILHSTP